MTDPRPDLVLLVDDDEVDRIAVRRALLAQEIPVEIVDARSAEEALALLGERAFDLVFLDYQLPGKNGLAVLQTLRERGDDAAVVVLTGQGDDRTAVELMKAGATDYLSKVGLNAEGIVRATRNALRVRAAEVATRHATAALHESEQRLRLALDAADLGTWDHDLRSGSIWFDARSRAMFGASDDVDLCLDTVMALVHPDDRPLLTDNLALITMPEQDGRTDVEYRVGPAADGEVRWIRSTGRVLFADTGEAARIVGVSQDVTRRKRQEALQQRQVEFEQQLIGIVSHDLRNPISVVTMSAALLLKRGRLDPTTTSMVERILSSGERAGRLIRDLLDFTRARAADGIPVHPELVDLAEIVRTTLDEVRVGFPAREVSYAHSGDGRGEWDPDRVSQIVANLVINALCYSPADAPVDVRTTGLPDRVRLEVYNAGDPIPPEVQAALFRPYRRGHERGADRSIGLGLYIVDLLVQAHGGSIRVDSAARVGTTFTIELPRRTGLPPRANPSQTPADAAEDPRRVGH